MKDASPPATGQKILLLACLVLLLLPEALPAGTQARLNVNEAVQEAIAGNPVIEQYEQRIQSARYTAKSTRADLFPEAVAEYGYTGLKETPIIKMPTGSFDAAHRNQYNWSVSIIQPLFTGFALSARYQKAKLETEIRRLEKQQVILDLTQEVKSACYNLLLAQKLLTVAEEEVSALTAHDKDARLFYQQELIPRNDLLRSQVALADSRQKRQNSRNRVEKARVQLNRLLHRPLEAPIVVRDIQDTPELTGDYQEYAGRAIRQRPLMASVQAGLEAMGLDRKMARSGLYPEISLIGSYQQSGDGPRARHNDYTNSYNTSVSVQATWTFWDWGKDRHQAAAVEYRMKSLAARIDSLRDQIRQQVKNAVLDCQMARENIATAETVLTQARENYRITNLQYQQQVATSTDVLDARTYLTRADTNYYNSLYGYLSALAELTRVVGGDVPDDTGQ